MVTLLLSLAAAFGAAQPSGSSIVQPGEGEKRFAETIARKLFVEFLDEREFKLKDGRTRGTAEADDPKENVEIEVEELQMVGGTVAAKGVLRSPFKLEGSTKRSGKKVKVSAIVDLEFAWQAVANVQQIGDEMMIRVKIEDAECEVKKVRKQKPSDLDGLDEVIEDLFREGKEELLRDLNKWLEEERIDARG